MSGRARLCGEPPLPCGGAESRLRGASAAALGEGARCLSVHAYERVPAALPRSGSFPSDSAASVTEWVALGSGPRLLETLSLTRGVWVAWR